MTKDEALRLALKAMKVNNSAWKHLADSGDAGYWEAEEQGYYQLNEQAIKAVEAALEAKDEPWEQFCDSHCVWTDHHPDCKLAKQKPVAWMCADESLINKGYARFSHVCMGEWKIPVYTTPPQRTWVGLTEEEIQDLIDVVDHYNFPEDLITYTQAKLKEKNT